MGLGMACRSFRRIWPMLELRVPPRLFPSRLPTLRLWSPWLLPSGVRTLRLCACEFWWRFRSRHARGLARRRRAPLDAPMCPCSESLEQVVARVDRVMLRDQKFADSSLEQRGFELLVPPRGCRLIFAAEKGLGSIRVSKRIICFSRGPAVRIPFAPAASPSLWYRRRLHAVPRGRHATRRPFCSVLPPCRSR